ncbi:MAG: 2-oxoacid:acceptor oxidoreductase subunit alpha [Sulfolobales archaeon]|nr:2-oxoacid:acceptor oxidoreductase subunit alpha [Sulfolobales archaeon]MDW8010220.1 2-oxoacid:acceptor oxidoreductase subunit alpha [Sulfolobales archaeon]
MRYEYLTGNIAIAEASITSGLRFYAGYPITPTSDIFEYLARELPKYGGHVIQFEDEIASINAVIGASWACSKAMTATSGPGFSLMLEALSLAVITETPLVVAYVMRTGPSTGVPTRSGQYDVLQSTYGFHGGLVIPVLAPSTPQEAYDLTIKAFNVSEKLRTPVVLLSDAVIAHTYGKVAMREKGEVEVVERSKPSVPPSEYRPYDPVDGLVPPMACFGDGYGVLVESLTHDERGYYSPRTDSQRKLMWRLYRKIAESAGQIFEYSSLYLDSCDVALVSYGSTALSAQVATKVLRERGVRACSVKFKTLFPVYEEGLAKLLEGVEKVFVVENNTGLYYRELRGVLKDREVVSVPLIDLDVPLPQEVVEVVSKWL